MDIEEIRNYNLSKRGVTEGLPFGDDTLVFKVLEKVFCLLNLDPPHSINLKCDPEKAVELRERYEAVRPGYHMNKKHWNTVDLDRSVPDKFIKEWIDHSYELVVDKMTKKEKEELSNL